MKKEGWQRKGEKDGSGTENEFLGRSEHIERKSDLVLVTLELQPAKE